MSHDDGEFESWQLCGQEQGAVRKGWAILWFSFHTVSCYGNFSISVIIKRDCSRVHDFYISWYVLWSRLLYLVITTRLLQSCTQWGLASMTLQGQQVHPHISMPPPLMHTERSGANYPSVFTSVKAGKETYISRTVRGEVFLLRTRWQCKMFVVLESSKMHS